MRRSFVRSLVATLCSWGASIRVLWFNLAALTLIAVSANAQDISGPARLYAINPTASNRALLLQAAAQRDVNGGLALLAVAAQDLKSKRERDAIPLLRSARTRVSKLADFADYLLASASFAAGDYPSAAAFSEAVLSFVPKSSMTGPAAMTGARAYLAAGDPVRAIRILQRAAEELPQPQGEQTLAVAYEKAEDVKNSLVHYQRVWLDFPASAEAVEASNAIARLRAQLGSRYVPPAPSAFLIRATKWMEARDFARARAEFVQLAASRVPTISDVAAVRVGVADYRSRKYEIALRYLRALRVENADADAERLYYVLMSARRLKQYAVIDEVVSELGRRHPRSDWRLQALVGAGDEYFGERGSDSLRLFETCYADFPDSPQAPYCHWKVALAAYLSNRAGAAELMKQHVFRYPESDKASASLYYLGRIAERNSRWGEARAWYDHLDRIYGNYYYAVLARQRKKEPRIAAAAPEREVSESLKAAVLPRRISAAHFAPASETRERFERAKLLSAAALDDLATAELRFGAKVGTQPEAYGMELARVANARSAPEQGIRYIKRYAPGYLFAGFDSLPEEFWKLAFPIPFRQALVDFSKSAGLDPFMVAALVRQESEFDPQALSRARAYGLTQILPATGRELSRRLGLTGFRTSLLFEPEFNLRLGIYYLQRLLGQFDNRWEPTLASYNAGKSRADAWLARSGYREISEWVEQIPFSETRNYVQVVIRNADIYRRLYGSSLTN